MRIAAPSIPWSAMGAAQMTTATWKGMQALNTIGYALAGVGVGEASGAGEVGKGAGEGTEVRVGHAVGAEFAAASDFGAVELLEAPNAF